jgi:hypothetical protein
MNPEWKQVEFGGFMTLSVPEDASKSDVQGIDSEVAEWKSEMLTIRIDHGLYADRLTSHRNRPGYVEHDEELAAPGRFVEFDGPDGSRYVAANFDMRAIGRGPATVTVSVETSDPTHVETARRVIRSIRFPDADGS